MNYWFKYAEVKKKQFHLNWPVIEHPFRQGDI